MELRIVSDGTPQGTRIEDANTGEVVEGIAGIRMIITPTEVAVAEVILRKPPFELSGDFTPVAKGEPSPGSTVNELLDTIKTLVPASTEI